MRPLPLGTIPAVVLIALGQSACVVAADTQYTVTDDVDAVVLDLGKGDVQVAVGYPGEVYVELDMGGLTTADLGPRIEDGILYLEYRCGGASICGGDLFVAVPPGMAVDADLGAGSLEAWDLSGNLRAEVGSGDLWAEGLSGDVVWLATGAGAVEAGFVERPTDARLAVGAGDAWLAVPEGSYDLDIDAGAGAVSTWNVSHDSSSDSHLTIQGGAGAVHVEGIPTGGHWH